MQSETVSVYNGSQYAMYITVYTDGRLTLTLENDGCAFLRHGAERTVKEIDMAAVATLDREYLRKNLVTKVLAARQRLGAREGVDAAM